MPSLEIQAAEWIVGEQKWSVEVYEVYEAGDLGRGGDTECSLDHTPEHYHHAVGAGGVDHLQGAPDAATLGELYVHPAHAS